jgi:hypothetical protein
MPIKPCIPSFGRDQRAAQSTAAPQATATSTPSAVGRQAAAPSAPDEISAMRSGAQADPTPKGAPADPQPCPLLKLPDALHAHVLAFLEPPDRISLHQTCRTLAAWEAPRLLRAAEARAERAKKRLAAYHASLEEERKIYRIDMRAAVDPFALARVLYRVDKENGSSTTAACLRNAPMAAVCCFGLPIIAPISLAVAVASGRENRDAIRKGKKDVRDAAAAVREVERHQAVLQRLMSSVTPPHGEAPDPDKS